jgi:drug/metabolite transporter (DMT)-like permease
MNAALWFPLAVLAYSMFAVTGVIDKIVVSNKIKNPLVVSFWVSLFGIPSATILLVGLLPLPFVPAFRFEMPPIEALALITVAGLLLQLALMTNYVALSRGEATRVVAAIGAGTPVFALIFAYAILGERLGLLSYAAFGLLLAGAIVMFARPGRWLGWPLFLALLSAALGALQSVVLKLIYQDNHFISSFALLGLGNVVYCAALVVLVPGVRKNLARALPKRGKKPAAKRVASSGGFWILFNSGFGSLGVIVLNLALKLGPVSLVNALRGLQYVGLFLIALLLSHVFPKLLKEEMSAQTIYQKLLAIGLIGAGLALLTALR